jgi:hypothetical protein
MQDVEIYTCDQQEFLCSENREGDCAHRGLGQSSPLNIVGNVFAVDCHEPVALDQQAGGGTTVRHVGHNHL